MAQKRTWLILLALALIAGVLAPRPSLADAARSETEVSFVGDRFSLKANLDGLWQYAAGEEVGGWITIQRIDKRSESGWPRIQYFRVTGRKFPDNPVELTTNWAAKADWFVATTRYSENLGWGDEVKSKMRKAKLRELDLFGKHFSTHRAEFSFRSNSAMHLFYYVLFPDEFPNDRAYFGFEYQDIRHKNEEDLLSALPLHDVIAGFSLDRALAPSESTVTWSIRGNEHVVVNALRQQRTFYFNNNKARQCFAFSADGLWYATDEPGLLGTVDEKGFIGVLLLSEEDVQELEGDDFLSRAASAQQQRHGEKAEETTLEQFDCCIPNAIRSTGRWTVKGKLPGTPRQLEQALEEYEEIVLERVRYIAEVKPGWAAVVTASYTVGGDDRARSILESIRFSDAPDCFNDEIVRLSR